MNATPWGTQSKYGDYEIVGARENHPHLLGQGSFGKTYEAVRSDNIAGGVIREHVAIKVLNPELLSSEAKRFQFIQELLALTKFKHPNLIHYIRCGEEKGEVYYAMELCRGGDLARLVRRFGPLPEKVVALIGLQVATGLKEVHQRHRLVHRDIKPSNIMLVDELEPELGPQHLAYRFEQQEGLCRVVDFGLVNFALNAEEAPQKFVGSPMYASPEQIREQPMDGRCDIYSLGMTLWYLLQGKGPLLDANGEDLSNMRNAMFRHMDGEEFDEELPRHLTPEFRSVLQRMLQKRPEARYANATEAQNALRQYLATAPNPKGATGPSEAAFAVKRIAQPLETVYEIQEKLPSRWAQSAYRAKEKSGGREVKMSVVANVEANSPAASAALACLTKFAELSRQPSLPEALIPVRDVIQTADLLACTEDYFPHVALSDVLRARANAKRPMGFSEAVLILRPVAEALDFLLKHGQDNLPLPCEELWLTRDSTGSNGADPQTLVKPLGEWAGLQVRFSMAYLAPSEADSFNGSSSFGGQTMSGSLNLTGMDLHPVLTFARLVYRILNGSEVPAAVQFAPAAYVPAVTLSHASNNLLRDLICRQRPWSDTTSVLKDLCTNEGIVWRASSGNGVARVVSPGIVQSPYASSGSTQAVPQEQWQPGAELVCAETGKRLVLPLNLPPREPVRPAAARDFDPTMTVGANSAATVFDDPRLHGRPPAFTPPPPPPPKEARGPLTAPRPSMAPSPTRPVESKKVVLVPVTATPITLVPAAGRGAKRSSGRRSVAPLAAIAAVLVLGGAGFAWYMFQPVPEVLPLVSATPPPAPLPAATPAPRVVDSKPVTTVSDPVAPPSRVPDANPTLASLAPPLPAGAPPEAFRSGEKWQNSLGMRFIPVSGTEAAMSVWVVRVRDFATFVQAAGYDAGATMLSFSNGKWARSNATWMAPGFFQSPNHPVVGVSAEDARIFCHWLTQKERDEHLIDDTVAYRLPTDDEWSKASDATLYPWGPSWPPQAGSGNYAGEEAAAKFADIDSIPGYRDGFATTSPVGSFPANPNGFYDMGGNVAQWCETSYQQEMNAPEVLLRNSQLADDGSGKFLTIRGASCFDSGSDVLRTDYRRGKLPSVRAAYIGFRCVLAPLVQKAQPVTTADDGAKPSSAGTPANSDGADPSKPATAGTQPTGTDDAAAAVDPRLVGVWSIKGPHGKVQKWEIKPDGHYLLSGPKSGGGMLTGNGGQMKQLPSDAGAAPVDAGYSIDGNKLVTTGPNGEQAEWRRVSGPPNPNQKKGDGVMGVFKRVFH